MLFTVPRSLRTLMKDRMNSVKPIQSISFHTTNASGVIDPVQATLEPSAITVDGKIDAAVQDMDSCQRTRDQIALLKMLALGRQEIDAGNVTTTSLLSWKQKMKKSAARVEWDRVRKGRCKAHSVLLEKNVSTAFAKKLTEKIRTAVIHGNVVNAYNRPEATVHGLEGGSSRFQ